MSFLHRLDLLLHFFTARDDFALCDRLLADSLKAGRVL